MLLISHFYSSLMSPPRIPHSSPAPCNCLGIPHPTPHPASVGKFPPVEPICAVQWSPDGTALRIIDQRRLPIDFVKLDLRTLAQVRDAISTLAVRGAPAIGVAAAIGLVASLLEFE